MAAMRNLRLSRYPSATDAGNPLFALPLLRSVYVQQRRADITTFHIYTQKNNLLTTNSGEHT